MKWGRLYSIVAVAEVWSANTGKTGHILCPGNRGSDRIETRETVLGYIQRGGSPSPYDRILGTLLGGHAVQLIHEGKFGRMVARLGNKISDVPLSEVAGKLRLVTAETALVQQGKKMGISFGVW